MVKEESSSRKSTSKTKESLWSFDRGDVERGTEKLRLKRKSAAEQNDILQEELEKMRQRCLEVMDMHEAAEAQASKYRSRYDAERRDNRKLREQRKKEDAAKGDKSSKDVSRGGEDAANAEAELKAKLEAKEREIEKLTQSNSNLQKSAAAARSAAEAATVAAEAASGSAVELQRQLEAVKSRMGADQSSGSPAKEGGRKREAGGGGGDKATEEKLRAELERCRTELTAAEASKRLLEVQMEESKGSEGQLVVLQDELETLVGMAEQLDRELQMERASHTKTKQAVTLLEEMVEQQQDKLKSGAAVPSLGLPETMSQPLVSPRLRISSTKQSRKSKMWPFRKNLKTGQSMRHVSSGAETRRDVAAGPESKQHFVPSSDPQPKPMAAEQMRKELEVLILLGEKLQEELQAERKAHVESKEMLLEQQLIIEQMQDTTASDKRKRGLDIPKLKKGRKPSRVGALPSGIAGAPGPETTRREGSDKSTVLVSNAINAEKPTEGSDGHTSIKADMEANLRDMRALTAGLIAAAERSSP